MLANQPKALDSALERRNTLIGMKRRPKKVIAYGLLTFFAFGMLCFTFAAPGRALASVSPCSQMPGGKAMRGCEHPNYLCGLDPSSNLLSQATLSSARSNDSQKNLLGLAFGGPAINVASALAPPGAREWKNVSISKSDKVSIGLFNSTLNL